MTSLPYSALYVHTGTVQNVGGRGGATYDGFAINPSTISGEAKESEDHLSVFKNLLFEAEGLMATRR